VFHKYDVWEHSLRALQHAADREFDLETRLSALFHDVAKPQTKRKVGNKTTYFGHEVLGAKFSRETLNNLKYSKEIVEKVTKMVRWHMFFSDPDEITLTAVRRMIVRVGKEDIWDLMNIRKCDRIGTGRPKEQPFRFRKYQAMVEEALRDPISVGMLKINGETLQEKFHVERGPIIGNILYAIFNEVLDDPSKNNEEYLERRVKELKKLTPNELDKLGKEGKQRLKTEDEREVGEINKKFGVN
jgi:tRNA nucleotidyltransferase (CCA-adding enzyme)